MLSPQAAPLPAGLCKVAESLRDNPVTRELPLDLPLPRRLTDRSAASLHFLFFVTLNLEHGGPHVYAPYNGPAAVLCHLFVFIDAVASCPAVPRQLSVRGVPSK